MDSPSCALESWGCIIMSHREKCVGRIKREPRGTNYEKYSENLSALEKVDEKPRRASRLQVRCPAHPVEPEMGLSGLSWCRWSPGRRWDRSRRPWEHCPLWSTHTGDRSKVDTALDGRGGCWRQGGDNVNRERP